MKKIIAVLVFLLIFLNLARYCFATDWIKYENNPVMTPSSSGWDSGNISSAFILKDEHDYKMWYQGNGSHWQIGLATSADGINWIKHQNNPVVIPENESEFNEAEVLEPCVLKTDIYRMWFKSNDAGDQHTRLRMATSTDGINWKKYPHAILIGENSWEKKGVSNPSVIFKDGKYMMWYMAWGSSWKIGYAESYDGINWTKYQNNPLNLPSAGHVGAPHVIIENNKFYMVYHTGGSVPNAIYLVESLDGINWNCLETCSIIASENNGFDSWMMGAPDLMKIGGKFYLWYGGLQPGSSWKIGLATLQIQKANPITIVIPGFLASWNKDAIIYNHSVDSNQWKINPFIKEYEGIKNTLNNLDLTENYDYYVFAYDWRKNLDATATDLNNFIEGIVILNHPNSTINLVGHSLGGLLARIYQQKFSFQNIKHIITAGSPHQGTAQVYKAVEAGEINKENTPLWLSEKILIQLYRNGLKTDKEILNENFPILEDLLPIYPFLFKKEQVLSIDDMSIKNDTLLSYDPIPDSVISMLTTLSGQSEDSLFGYYIEENNTLDKLLNNYIDGRPTQAIYKTGDGLILQTSAKIGNNPINLNLNHGELIYKKEAINSILDALELPHDENQIIEGQKTTISPSLVFLVLSPVQITVEGNGQTYQENEGLLFIENAKTGKYTIKAQGKDLGKYSIIIGKIGTENDTWERIEGEVVKNPATEQTDVYEIYFDQTNLMSTPALTNNPVPTAIITTVSTTLAQTANNPSVLNSPSFTNEQLATNNSSAYPINAYLKKETMPDLEILGESTIIDETISPTFFSKIISNSKLPIIWPILFIIVVLVTLYFLVFKS